MKKTKLIIQTPCFNEENTIGITLDSLPQEIAGISHIEYLIVDDGSTDKTVDVARAHGVHHVVSHITNRGLASAFMSGVQACLDLGADIIVNTDADNQYDARYIPDLVHPILQREADMAVGCRPINAIQHFSPFKNLLQKVGSCIVRKISHTEVGDVPSGFRAFSRDLAMHFNVYNSYSYTIETLIQAGYNRYRVVSVPVGVNQVQRPSRLVRSTGSYVWKSMSLMIRIMIVYWPFPLFFALGVFLVATGTGIGLRYLYYYFFFSSAGKLQSLILATILIIIGINTALFAFLSDLVATNRRLLEDIQFRVKSMQYVKKVFGSDNR